jgi:hypothetical protein
MSRERPLQGGCSCGRNRYTILIPKDATEVAQVFFDSGHAHRKSVAHFMPTVRLTEDPVGKSQASPLSAWLRVPLSW